MIKIKNFFNIRRFVIAVIFTGAVLVLTHIPQEAILSRLQVSGLDKLAHALAYGAITLLFVLLLRTSPTLLLTSLLFFAILALGTLDEVTQPFVNRTASLSNWLAEIVGVMSVLFFFHVKRTGHQSTLTTKYPTPET